MRLMIPFVAVREVGHSASSREGIAKKSFELLIGPDDTRTFLAAVIVNGTLANS